MCLLPPLTSGEVPEGERLSWKAALLLVALASVVGGPVYATTITYSTSGTLTCTGCTGNGTNSVQTGSVPDFATITYVGLTNQSVCGGIAGNGACTTNASFGDFFSAAGGTGGSFTNGSFTLTLTQTAPAPTGGSPATFSTTFSGTITTTTNAISVSFDNADQSRTITAVLGNTTYTIPSVFLLVPPTTNGGDTSVQGQIAYVPVPEPSTISLLSLGLLGLGAMRRKAGA
jgi:hypothetical protein